MGLVPPDKPADDFGRLVYESKVPEASKLGLRDAQISLAACDGEMNMTGRGSELLPNSEEHPGLCSLDADDHVVGLLETGLPLFREELGVVCDVITTKALWLEGKMSFQQTLHLLRKNVNMRVRVHRPRRDGRGSEVGQKMVDFGLILHLGSIETHLPPMDHVRNNIVHELNRDGWDKVVRRRLEGVNVVVDTRLRDAFLPIKRDSNEVNTGTLVL